MDESDVDEIIKTIPYVRAYYDFNAIINLGVQVHANELPIDRVLMFAWIKEHLKCQRNSNTT